VRDAWDGFVDAASRSRVLGCEKQCRFAEPGP